MPVQHMSSHTFYLENLGCSKNQVDAEIMITKLTEAGWSCTDSPDDAECIVVNTCGFIEPAKKESIETTLSFRAQYPDKKILMAGCFAQRYGGTLLDQLPEVDGVFGNHDLNKAPEALSAAIAGSRQTLIPEAGGGYPTRSRLLSFPGSAYVKISEGCNHRCSYCAIPLIRGNLRSRLVEEIISEIRELVTKGTVEINLIAQDLAAFGTDRGSGEFLLLLEKISQIEGSFWVRLLYIYPDDFPFEILGLMKKDRRFLPYFDLPFQHADRKVLSLMGRRGDSRKYLQLVDTIRRELPSAVIRSTFMAGFPSEGPEERKELLSFLEEASLDWAGFFIYSREEDTRAYSFRNVNTHAAEKFMPRLEDTQGKITEQRMDAFINRELDVLIEERVAEEPLYFGRGYFQAPEVDGSTIVLSEKARVPGELVRCRIVKRNGIDLEAVPLDEL